MSTATDLDRWLCIGSPTVQALDEDEFWEYVFNRHTPSGPFEPSEDDEEPEPGTLVACSVCGQTAACGYDSDGEPWIHSKGFGEPDA